MREVLEDITKGKGKKGDIELLEHIAQTVNDASLCALGQTASNPVLSTLNYFRKEYETHIKRKKCPAKVCKELLTFKIDQEKCNGCGVCITNCPQDAITSAGKKEPATIEQAKCIKCGACDDVCKFDAVEVK